jgi:hypothetical protein
VAASTHEAVLGGRSIANGSIGQLAAAARIPRASCLHRALFGHPRTTLQSEDQARDAIARDEMMGGPAGGQVNDPAGMGDAE